MAAGAEDRGVAEDAEEMDARWHRGLEKRNTIHTEDIIVKKKRKRTTMEQEGTDKMARRVEERRKNAERIARKRKTSEIIAQK